MNARTAVIAPKTISSQIAIPRNEFRTTQIPREHIAKLSSFIGLSTTSFFHFDFHYLGTAALASIDNT